jgi:hypothetical protein
MTHGIGRRRRVEAAEPMIAMNKYTISYAKSLVAATPQAQLADEQTALMERESASLKREFRIADLVLPMAI